VAHQDETTTFGTTHDDWFHDHHIDDNITAAAQSDPGAQRRFTVLSDASSDEPTDSLAEADWFDDGTERLPIETDPDSFDARTARLRDHRTTTPGSPQRTWWQRRRAAAAVTTSLAVVLGGIGAAALWATSTTDDPAARDTFALDDIVTTTAAPTTSSAPAAAGTAAANVTWCAGQAAGKPVTEDSTDPGMAAIWRFEKAFYYDRDGAAARAQAAPDAVLASAQRLQQGIDALEPDIEFCVLADPVSPGVYDVTVVERGPGIDGRTAAQRFTTAETGGQTLITAIAQR
jgi:hypothetical protein